MNPAYHKAQIPLKSIEDIIDEIMSDYEEALKIIKNERIKNTPG